ncbi:MAG: hydroxyisourate hydrolase [Pseudarthrobacter sp.]
MHDGAGWVRMAEGMPDSDGRINELGPERLPSGTYRLAFDRGKHFTASVPEVTRTFSVVESESRYHVPLLLSPFAYSTYRGS